MGFYYVYYYLYLIFLKDFVCSNLLYEDFVYGCFEVVLCNGNELVWVLINIVYLVLIYFYLYVWGYFDFV